MKEKAIVVTGASGFIGGEAANRFDRMGWRVVRPSRDRFDLAGFVDPALFENVDVVLHAEYGATGNLRGTRLLAAAARAAGARSIFLSSFAAHPDALSLYGREKYIAESFFDIDKDTVLRPGLVLGPGGLFGRLVGYLRRSRIVPLIDGGRQPLQTIHICDLIDIIDRVATSGTLPGQYNLAEPAPVAYREFVAIVARQLGRNPWFVGVPSAVLGPLLQISQALGIHLPVSEENLLGLKTLRARETNEDARRIGVEIRPLAESVKDLARVFDPSSD